MKNHFIILAIALCLCFRQTMAIGLPLMEVPLSSIIGIRDLIVVGTVVSVKENSVSPLQPLSANIMDNLIKGVAVLRVHEVIRGKYTAKEISVSYHIVPPWIAPGASQTRPRVEQQELFLLQRTADGYRLHIETGMRPLADRAAVIQVIKAIPLEVTIVTPLKPCYFGRQSEIQVQVRNLTDRVVKYDSPQLAGVFYYTRGMSTPGMPLPPMPAKMEIAARGVETIAIPFICQEPAEMAIFGAESYLLTPISISVSIVVFLSEAEKGELFDLILQTVKSPWENLYVGYPLIVD